MSKRHESGGHDMPEVCEGCTPKTKVKLLAERGAFFANCAVGAPTGKRTFGGTERREEGAPTAHCEKAATFFQEKTIEKTPRSAQSSPGQLL